MDWEQGLHDVLAAPATFALTEHQGQPTQRL